MRKSLFIVSSAILFSLSSFGQDKVISDFESGTTIFNLTGSNYPASIVDNPLKEGINTSNKVLKVKAMADWQEDLAAASSSPYNFYTHPVASFKVYVTDTISLNLRLDKSGHWQNNILSAEFPLNDVTDMTITGDKIGKWVEMTYDLSQWDNRSGYSIFKIMTTSHTQIDSFYIDDVKFLERSPKFDKNTTVPIFFDPVTAIKWVGDWAVAEVGGFAYALTESYGIQKDGFNMLKTERIKLSPNGYMAWPNDTIKGSSGGAAYILTGVTSGTDTLTFPLISTGGVSNLSLKFDLAVIGKSFIAGLAPKVEVKFSDSTDWEQALVLSNLPSADSTWTTVTAAINGVGKYTTIRFSNEKPSTDSIQFWFDDLTLLGTTTPTDSIKPAGTDDLNIVTVGGTLQFNLKSFPADAADNASWEIDTTGNNNKVYATVDGNGLVTGVAAKDTVWLIVTTADGTNLKDTLLVKVQAEPISVSQITVSAPVDALNATTKSTYCSAVIKPANATNKSVTWSVNSNIALINVVGLLKASYDGEVVVTATANDASAVTGTKTFTVTGLGASAVKETASPSIVISPNPVTGSFTVIGAEVKTIQIVNAGGSLVKSVDGSTEVSVDGLSAGVYFVRVVDTKGKVSIVKIVKQ